VYLGSTMKVSVMRLSVLRGTSASSSWPQMLVADGPFAETKEQVGGYQLIECGSRDDALYAAARHPLARSGVLVEVRPMRTS
jgi:hypothetical protein